MSNTAHGKAGNDGEEKRKNRSKPPSVDDVSKP
jgi:hypothetical protein